VSEAQLIGLLAGLAVGGAMLALLVWVALRQRRRAGPAGAGNGAEPADVPTTRAAELERRLAELEQTLAQTQAELIRLRERLGEAAGAPASRADAREVLHLGAQGLDVEEIARRVGRPVGEVELMLNLHGRAGAGARSAGAEA
jgi:hypothetical protein